MQALSGGDLFKPLDMTKTLQDNGVSRTQWGWGLRIFSVHVHEDYMHWLAVCSMFVLMCFGY